MNYTIYKDLWGNTNFKIQFMTSSIADQRIRKHWYLLNFTKHNKIQKLNYWSSKAILWKTFIFCSLVIPHTY